uniref:Calmodulin-like protein 3 n=1 Tax=Cicer arietinum TaxID=3827 RepID=A0A1S2XPX0_CICAR|nr:calmodulin-like protein 3 [Cicer arietinum]
MFGLFGTFFTVLNKKVKFLFNHPKNINIIKDPNMGMSNQFKQIFELIDTNGDGKISTNELTKLLSCLGYKDNIIATKEAEGMVNVLDSNGDGFVDLEEFMVVMDDKEGMFGCVSDKEQDEYLMDAFLVFDTDKNGLISAKELKRVMINLEFDNCSVEECKRMIKGVDKNGDGFVDFEEFRSMMKLELTN